MAKTGIPKAAAICIGPESLLTIKRAFLITSINSFRSVLPAKDVAVPFERAAISFAISGILWDFGDVVTNSEL